MRRRSGYIPVILGILSLGLYSAAEAQFDAFPDSNAHWVVHLYDGPNYWGEEVYSLSNSFGDTLIAGVIHTQLYNGSTPIGAVRENGSGQVYFHKYEDDTSYLLYDFAVSAGDTVFPYNEPYMTSPLYVVTVDSVLYSGSRRRRIGVSPVANSTIAASFWVQGIGGLQGAFMSGGPLTTCACVTVSMSYQLFCASSNDTIQYGPGEGTAGNCLLLNGLNTAVDPVNERSQFHPNPSTGHFTLSGSGPGEQVLIFDPQGRVILRTRESSFDLSTFAPGTYTAVISTAAGRQARRLILVR